MKIKCNYTDLHLGLYEYVDNKTDRFGENRNLSKFFQFESCLQAFFINNDIKNLRDFESKKSGNPISEIEKKNGEGTNVLEFINLKKAKAIVDFLKEKESNDAETLKEQYYNLLHDNIFYNNAAIKPNDENRNEEASEDQSGFGLTRKQEGELAERVTFGEEEPPKELDKSLIESLKLTPVEAACLQYLSDSEYNENPIINIFSHTGIVQMANKGAIKLYLNSQK